MNEEYKKLPFSYKIKYWADKYNSTPNGWAVAALIQQQYRSQAAAMSSAARRKRK